MNNNNNKKAQRLLDKMDDAIKLSGRANKEEKLAGVSAKRQNENRRYSWRRAPALNDKNLDGSCCCISEVPNAR